MKIIQVLKAIGAFIMASPKKRRNMLIQKEII